MYTFHCFWLLVALSSDLATLCWKWMTQSTPRHCINLLAVHQNGEAVQQAKLPDIATINLLHFCSFQGAASYTPVLLMSDSLLLHWKTFKKCPKYCIQLFVGQPSARMQRNCVKSADNFCYTGGKVTFFHHRSVP